MHSRIVGFLVIVLLLTACGSSGSNSGGGPVADGNRGGESELVGKWRIPKEKIYDCNLYQILSGYPQVEFFSDQTAVNYDVLGDEEVARMSGNYTFPDSNRIKIVWQGGRFVNMLNYSVSDNTLTLCAGNQCCDLQRR